MNHSPLISSNIKSCAYHEGTLELVFRNGSRYQYRGVPQKVYDELKAADSAGKYFASNIRGRFKHSRVPDVES